MRSLILLTALWLVVQYGAMALSAVSHRSSPSQGFTRRKCASTPCSASGPTRRDAWPTA